MFLRNNILFLFLFFSTVACQGGRDARRAHGVQLASPQNPQLQEPAGGEAAHGADRAAGPAAARDDPGGP